MTKTIFIEGMTCNNCVRHVETALSELAGVTSIKVDLAEKKAVIMTTQEIADQEIISVIDDIGYKVKEIIQ
jgi:copper chaperone